jgi:hypothetical protein
MYYYRYQECSVAPICYFIVYIRRRAYILSGNWYGAWLSRWYDIHWATFFSLSVQKRLFVHTKTRRLCEPLSAILNREIHKQSPIDATSNASTPLPRRVCRLLCLRAMEEIQLRSCIFTSNYISVAVQFCLRKYLESGRGSSSHQHHYKVPDAVY